MAIRPLTGKTLYSGNGAVVPGSNGAIGRASTGFRSSWNGNLFAPPPESGCVMYLPGHPGTGTTITDFSTTLLDVGSAVSDRGGNAGATYTYIDLANPADYTGYINHIQIWANQNMTGLKVGTFYLDSGTTYICRDSVTIGSVTAGSAVTFGDLRIRVVAGDLIGCYFATGGIEWDELGGSGIKAVSGDKTAKGTSTDFGATAAGDAISIYATGVGSYGNNGAITGATYVRLPSGLWVNSFDGTDDVIAVADNVTVRVPFDGGGTILVWINPTGAGESNLGVILGTLSGGTGWLMRGGAIAGGKIPIVFGQKFDGDPYEEGTDSAIAPIGSWSFISATYNSGATANRVIISLNGAVQASTRSATPTGTRDNTALTLAIGNTSDTSLTFDGKIGLTRILKGKSLTSAEQSVIYQSERHLYGV
ncbi:MAG: LamG-like jellyroll fold domain-containing protein [Syntrophales bacterium]